MAAQLATSVDNYLKDYVERAVQNNRNSDRKDGMHMELFRLASYKKWPRWAPLQPNRLARAGFFYTGTNDETECFCCHYKVTKWHDGDRPVDRHQRLSRNCAFANNQPSFNIPLPRPADSPDRPMPMEVGNIGGMQSSASSAATVGDSNTPTSPTPPNIPRSVLRPEYQDEQVRLRTFRNWPTTAYVGAEELAQSGFVYLDHSDRVQCTFCRGVLKNWAPGDRAYVEHQKHFPHCPFISNPSAANVPSNVNPQIMATNVTQNQLSARTEALQELGIETNLPKNPTFAVQSLRLASFSNWPVDLKQKPEDLATAGFFYIGQSDSVKCYWCDGGLRNWDANDDPWVEHARWFPKCGHVKRVKGGTFVKDIQEKKKKADALKEAGTNLDPREITSRLDTPVVKSVLEMGFEKQFMRDIIEYKLRTSGDDFTNAEQLLEVCLQFKDSPPANFPMSPPEGSTIATAPGAEGGTGAGAEAAPGTESINLQPNRKNTHQNRLQEAAALSSGKNMECKVCMDADVNIVFLPCGHLVCCTNCAPALTICPICRGRIKGTVDVFLS